MKKKLTVMRRVVVAVLLLVFLTEMTEQEVCAVENKIRVEDGNTAVNLVLPEYGTCFMGGKTIYSDGTGRLRNASEVSRLMNGSGYDLWISANEGEMSVSVENFDTKGKDLYNMPDDAIKKFFGNLEDQIRNSMKNEGVKVSEITTDIVKSNKSKYLRVKTVAEPPYSEVYQYCTLKQNKMITIKLVCYNKIKDINSFALNPNSIVQNTTIEKVVK
ncbi:hypothetical protein SAMN02910451_01783 [Butyrivibrio hungatei]|uniref:Uncharacterized protein n=1 Tax=Butyrivibrio hungatei TaxID=185008 RepID=A0A1G5E4H4_9FIRM|nr:hypothetical protein [Butyrivibrio hungatei]MBQ4219551.1 hypothetical protein [Butyrivibrio sp.]MEE3471624.1 hypothetical protein [Butyrivibrio hungatei]SCY21862.1 hypothetical protein SAMN02910451_01783 [Butyrivibrio hungatei]